MNNLEIGKKVIIGKTVEVKAEVLSIGNKIKIQREDKEKPTYIYEKDIVRVLCNECNTYINKIPKYVDIIINNIKNDINNIANICKTIPNIKSATGFIRPSQLDSSIKYLIDNNIIIKINKIYKLKEIDE